MDCVFQKWKKTVNMFIRSLLLLMIIEQRFHWILFFHWSFPLSLSCFKVSNTTALLSIVFLIKPSCIEYYWKGVTTCNIVWYELSKGGNPLVRFVFFFSVCLYFLLLICIVIKIRKCSFFSKLLVVMLYSRFSMKERLKMWILSSTNSKLLKRLALCRLLCISSHIIVWSLLISRDLKIQLK